MSTQPIEAPPERRVYCNRTLNMKALKAVGFDMDYTLVHYHVDQWEARAFAAMQENLGRRGWPVADLRFDPRLFVRGLIIDRELGHVVKADRFGYVKAATHGTTAIGFEALRRTYGRTVVDLDEARWVSLDTLFSQSEVSLYAQLVERLDAGTLPGAMGYSDLYERVKASMDRAHMEGRLKAEILRDPERFIALDPDLPLALMDLRAAGRKLLLITNSDWPYTRSVMSYAFDRYLDSGSWRDLFDVIIVSARKPDFFEGRQPLYEVVDDEGLLKPVVAGLEPGRLYSGGDAGRVEATLRSAGEGILYVGDHIESDVRASKMVLRWRTALVLRELEDEVSHIHSFQEQEAQLEAKMAEKTQVEERLAAARLLRLRQRAGYGPPDTSDPEALKAEIEAHKAHLAALDPQIAPLAQAGAALGNPHWGPLLRAGNEKSYLARLIEHSADLYTSRVSNLLYISPYAYLRSQRAPLPHDPAPETPAS
jgi:5'-nucleotidase